MSDGDNVSYVLHGLASDPKYFASPHHGDFPMNWTLPTTLIDLAPAALEWYYKNADQDYFIAGGSGAGYMYPSQYPDLKRHAERLNDYVERSDLSYVGILERPVIGDHDFHRVASIYAKQPNVKGASYVNYQSCPLGAGEMRFVGGKPFVALRENLWEADPAEMARRVNEHSRNPADPKSCTMMNIHAWSHDMDDVATIVANLAPHVKVVNVDTLFEQIIRNVDRARHTLDDKNFAIFHDSQSGILEQNGIIAIINHGDRASYKKVDFGAPGIEIMKVSASSATAGGTIEIRLDSPDGPVAGTVDIGHTTGWAAWQTFSGNLGRSLRREGHPSHFHRWRRLLV